MSNDPFSAPSTGGAKITDYRGSLLLITPTEYREGITTTFGEKDAVAADVVVLDQTESGAPEELSDVLIFQGVIIGQTKGKVNRGMVLGRLGQRPASKPGQNPAWALEDPTEADKQAARDYIAAKDPFA
jgi:hypothetical protein